jgi:cell division septal protein FtsQ
VTLLLKIKMRKRDYYKRQHGGPSPKTKQKMREGEKKNFWQKVILFFVLIFILLIIYWLFFSNFFNIKKIVIQGTDRAEQIEEIEKTAKYFLEQRKFLIFLQKNRFIFDKKTLNKMMENKFDLESSEIKIVGKGIEIKVKNKYPVVIWDEGEMRKFAVYNDGKIKEPVFDVQVYELPLVNRGTTTQVTVETEVIKKEQIEYIEKIFSMFDFYIKEYRIKNFEIPYLDSDEVTVVTEEGTKILFDINNNIEDDLENIKLLLEQLEINILELEYIDVRISDKIFYK